MPTPNIPDEVVDTALCCTPLNKFGDEMAMPIDFMRLGSGSDEDMEAARCVMRSALQAALPLLLEQVGYAKPGGLEELRRSLERNCIGSTAIFNTAYSLWTEPLYRLKVSNG